MEKSPSAFSISLRTPVLTRKRMFIAMAVAILADAIQIGLGPLGLFGMDQGIDLAAALLTMALLGFIPCCCLPF